MAKIELKKISKSFGSLEVIKDIDLTIKSGELMVFVGPSGCGKSTLLRMISGLETITDGDLIFDDERMNDMLPSDRKVAMVFQSYALYPHMNVYENMAFGLKISKRHNEKTIEGRVLEAARILQIEELLDRLPRELSGGQRQRVAIGRAITRKPKVFLLDEPLSNLDAALRSDTRLEIAKLHVDIKDATMIYVTHDQVEAMTLADRICVLKDGIIEQVGSPRDVYEKPESVFVAGFIGTPKMNFLSGHYAQTYKCHTIGIRPEHLMTTTQQNAIYTGMVMHQEYLGSDHYLFVKIDDENTITVRYHQQTEKVKGDTVYLQFDTRSVHRFDKNDRRCDL